jgi:hypothetical protein
MLSTAFFPPVDCGMSVSDVGSVAQSQFVFHEKVLTREHERDEKNDGSETNGLPYPG